MQLPGKVLDKSLIMTGLPLSFGILVMIVLLIQSNTLEKQASEADYYRAITTKGLKLSGLSYEIITTLSRYYLSKDQADMTLIPALLQDLEATVSEIRLAANEDPMVSHSVAQLLAASHELDTRFKDAVSILSQKKLTLESADRLYQHKIALTKDINTFAKGSKELADLAQKQEIKSRQAERQERELVRQSIVVSASLNVALSIAMLILFTREFRQRLEVIVNNTKRFSSNSPLTPRLTGSDEIAELDGFFHEMADEILAARQRCQQFYAMITHDLRTPLLAALLNVNALTEGAAGPLSETAQTVAQRTQRSIKRITHLIDDLLEIEKLESGSYELDLRKVMLDQIVKEAIDSLSSLIAEKNLALEQSLQESIALYADGRRLLQVVTNLLSNAIKFTPEGGSIKVSCKAEQSFAEFTVVDSGPGITAEYHDAIFQRFHQVPGSHATIQQSSTGLGLPICKLIIEQHNGAIGVHSVPGAGAEFWFKLPKPDLA